MAMKIDYKGLTRLYTKISQVNVKNTHQTETDENENETELSTRPMDIILHTYTDSTKANRVHTIEYTNISYDPDLTDTDPINQAYIYAELQLNPTETNI